MRASVDVAVVLKRAGVLEELAALVAVVPAHGVGREGVGLAGHTVDVVGAEALVGVHLAIAVGGVPGEKQKYSDHKTQ